MKTYKKEYALYHGDKFIDMGTKKYLANSLKVKVGTIEYYMSPVHRKRCNDNGWIVIRIEED